MVASYMKMLLWSALLVLHHASAFYVPLKMALENREQFVTRCATITARSIVSAGVAAFPQSSSATTPTHVLNSVLSAYGIPMIDEDRGDFTSSYTKLPPTKQGGKGTLCAFAYPQAWVELRKRDGLITAANYQSGDGLLLDVDPAPGKVSSIKQLDGLAIAAEATPTQGYVKVLEESVVSTGGVDYKYLTLKYNTVTRSGYDVERIAYVASTVRNRVLYSLVATVSSERIKRMKADLVAIRESFRVANVDSDSDDSTDSEPSTTA